MTGLKDKLVTITKEGRDRGKVFLLTEMSAQAAEEWGYRAILALANEGVDVGDVQGMGMEGVAVLGWKALAKLKWSDLKPLLDDMWRCVQCQPSPGVPARPLVDNDIFEPLTRVYLRAEVFVLHTDFSLPAGALSFLEGKRSTG